MTGLSSGGGGIIGGGAGTDYGTPDDPLTYEEINPGIIGMAANSFNTMASVPMMNSRAASGAQRITINVDLSKDLRGEIVDQTLGEVADVFMRMQ